MEAGDASAAGDGPDLSSRDYGRQAGWVALGGAVVMLFAPTLSSVDLGGWPFFLSVWFGILALSVRWRKEHIVDVPAATAIGVSCALVLPWLFRNMFYRGFTNYFALLLAGLILGALGAAVAGYLRYHQHKAAGRLPR